MPIEKEACQQRSCSSSRPSARAVIGRACALAASCALGPAGAFAQEASPSPSPSPAPQAAEPEARTTGLPEGVDWTFNLDASWANFGFANSLYTDPKPEQPSGDLGDNWFEGSAKPALAGVYTSAASWQVYGKLSVVGERTYGAAPSVVGEDASSFKAEDLSLGWRSGNSLGSSENLLDFTVGRARYQLGHGFLVWDGSAEGGSRGTPNISATLGGCCAWTWALPSTAASRLPKR